MKKGSCIDCKTEIHNNRALRCITCYNLYRHVPKKYCIDCSKLIQNRSKRCNRCHAQIKLRPLHIQRQQEKYKDVNISHQAHQILLGSLLGDGTLCKYKYSPSFREMHCLAQKEYLEWKADLLNLPNKQSIINIKQNGNIKDYKEVFYQTTFLPQLVPYYQLFYPNGKKVITREILDKLEPLGLAVWFMDDGNYNSTIRLSTYPFSYDQHLIIKKWFEDKFNIKIWIVKCKMRFKIYYTICIGKKESIKFLEIVKPFIHKTMLYKTIYNKSTLKEYYQRKYLKQRQKQICPVCHANNCIGRICKKCYSLYQKIIFIRDPLGKFVVNNKVLIT